MIAKYVIFMALLISATSCYYNKRLIYLQDKRFSEYKANSIQNKSIQYRVQPNDVLSVKVKSATDPLVSDIFNITPGSSSMYMGSPGSLFLDGYSVNNQGEITLPVIGTLKVKDMRLEEVQQVVQKSVQKYLNNATVMIKLVSFKVTVLGEVNNPGYHYVFNNQVTILEALGLAGDLTKFGNRRNVKLVRQTNGGSAVVLLDLTDSGILASEYFYLMPNDVLYVEPLRATSRRLNLDLLGIIFSAATTAILVLTYAESN